MKTNGVVENLWEAFNFPAANKDGNLYSFDIRKLTFLANVPSDHVSAVMDAGYCPTSREFVSASDGIV